MRDWAGTVLVACLLGLASYFHSRAPVVVVLVAICLVCCFVIGWDVGREGRHQPAGALHHSTPVDSDGVRLLAARDELADLIMRGRSLASLLDQWAAYAMTDDEAAHLLAQTEGDANEWCAELTETVDQRLGTYRLMTLTDAAPEQMEPVVDRVRACLRWLDRTVPGLT